MLTLLLLNLIAAPAPAVDPRCEYLAEPLGLDIAQPRFSWRLESAERGCRQTAWQIAVRAGDAAAWDSGRVESDATAQVEYAGRPLTANTRYRWRVRWWDQHGVASDWSAPAWFSTGPSTWAGGWIGLDEPPAPPPAKAGRLTVRRAAYQTTEGDVKVDVTDRIAALVKDGVLRVAANNDTLGGDPAYGRRKQLLVEYELDGTPGTATVAETESLTLPPGAEPAGDRLPTPRYLRRQFAVRRPVRRATVFVTALGLYELRLNGQRVGDHLLAPEWTNYTKRVQYQTFDVTDRLRTGGNVLGAILGNGWYCGNWQFWERALRPIYGQQPYLRAHLELELADGTKQIVATDADWRGTTDGPLRFTGIYEGETCDARRELPGWDTPGYDDHAWRPVTLAQPKVGALVWQRGEPIRVTQDLPPVAMTQPKPGVWVIDFGQNIAGWCRLRLDERAGAEITLRHNEVLSPDGTVYMDNLHAGHLSTGDRQIDRYVCRGDRGEQFEPHFTYHGFRYVQIEGLSRRPAPEEITARVFHTDFRPAGSFTCSDPLVDRLVSNIQWSQRGNMMGVPTDCCQRDERCGYTGDAQFFMPTAVYQFDVAAFFSKWLVDVCQDSQLPGGWFADHAPFYGPGAGPNVAWSDAGISCPYQIWRTYGDTRVIREHYEAMKRQMDWLERTAHGWLRGPDGVGHIDWLNLGGGASAEVVGTAYYAHECALMSEMARAIGRDEDAAAYHDRANKIAEAFDETFIGADGRIKDSSQTGFALAFGMGLAPAAKRVAMAQQFAAEIARFDGHLATGFTGTPRLLPALHAAGRDDLAYGLLLRRDYPSWLYPVTQGATTVWERWDGWRPEKGFQDSGMNSFNHYAFGSVGEYLFRTVGGIEPETPGYQRFRLRPTPGPGLTWAKTRYDSIAGRIECRWAVADGRLTLDVVVPANTSATVYVPTSDPASVTAPDGASSVRAVRGAAVYRVGSGAYRFEAAFGG
ncbi:MAG: family 78 glycoside hydrolase catalytic domain [Armatimonadetes bacterium]|nr:family 78 glycoside hydrolase catalytic domain [Armatimonadota bacterium]